MSQTPGIGSSREDRPPADSAYTSGSSSPVYGSIIQETVLNPEGRRIPGDGSTSSSPSPDWSSSPVQLQNSQLWRRLFPVESDPAGVVELEAPSGCELGHFSIEERIGSGGMGAVFRALDNRLQRVVAVKVLSPNQSRDPSAVSRFLNEARAAARLDHENIARVFYVGEDHGLHFIAFEYVTGQNVRDLIARLGQLPVADCVNYVLQIASALRHTASAGVVHRDIKPSNIIIAPNGRAKLVDLGLARKIAADSYGDLTVAGTTLGTFDYISPEQARDPRNVDVRSDIYSLGCTLYHMLTGGAPYSSGTVLQKLLDHQSGQAPDPRDANPAVPHALSSICRKMMAGEPKNRYSTPDDLIRDLVAVAGSLGLRPLPTDSYLWSRTSAPTAPRLRPGFIWAGSAAVVVILAFLVDIDPQSRTSSELASRIETRNAVVVPDQDSDVSSSDLPQGDAEVLKAAPLGNTEPESASTAQREGISDRQITNASSATSSPTPAERIDFPRPLVAQSGVSAPGPNFTNEGNVGRVSLAPGEGLTNSNSTTAGDTENQEFSLFTQFNNLLDLIERLPPAAPPEVASSGESRASDSTPDSSSTALPIDRESFGAAESPSRPYQLRSNIGGSEEAFNSLADAVESARPGDTIELNFDGLPPELELTQPIRVNEKDITIRAGQNSDGYQYHPVIAFNADPETIKSSNLITVTGEGGTLSLRNVELRVKVTGEASNSARQWAVFSLSDTQHIRLDNVGITIVERDPSWSMATFDLRLSEELSRNPSVVGMMSDASAGGFYVEINDSLIRGAGDLFSIAHTLPGTIRIRNSAFAVKQALLNVTGGIKDPPAGEHITVEIEHVTAVLGDALLRVDVDQIPRYVTPIRIAAKSNVLATSTAGPLVFMKGNASTDTFNESLTWDGERNVFDGFPEFWSAYTNDGDAESFPDNFIDWRSRWETIGEQEIPPGEDYRLWAKSEVKYMKSPEEFIAEDFALNRYSRDIVLDSGGDGELVGVDPSDLPRVSGTWPRTAQESRPSNR